ncbi:MAG TPA: lactate racemase domain-containing protein [Terriglobia bacterium]|nr:lactate racemase domain-containing protein [Terriglobia bacterium]
MAEACPASDYRGKKVLMIVPDGTRTAPMGLLFHTLHELLGPVSKALDVMVALGTHPPMSEEAICRRLEISESDRHSTYSRVQFFNHEWHNPTALKRIGVIAAEEIRELSGGLFSRDVPVEVNKRVFDYDRILIVGPVFPHEVVGFSGGNKYLFPGISGPELLNFFHWLGAVITTPRIIGSKWTPVRRVVDRAAAMLEIEKICIAMVVRPDESLAGLFIGTPEQAWDEASELSKQVHIVYKDYPFHTILSCAPPMYGEIWTAGKAMYKLEPVLASGGELILYAPHVREISETHGKTIREVGYHCRDYFLKQWEMFKHHPWGVLAHSAHVHGLGTYENGIEKRRTRITLATGIPPDVCREVNLGYRDPATIRLEDFANREDEGVLLVPKAGEILHQLKEPPEWAR